MSVSKESFKSPHLLSDEEILREGVKPSDVEIFRRTYYWMQFGLNTWCNHPNLSPFTFKTLFISLSFDEAQAIVDRHMQKTVEDPTQIALLKQLETKIDQSLETFKNRSAFIKLATRSPKDAPLYDFENKELQQCILEELNRVALQGIQSKKRGKMELKPVDLIPAFVRATNRYLKVENGKKALELLIESHRIREDLNRMLNLGKQKFEKVKDAVSIVLREWLEEVVERPQFEFRAFVHNNHINAITQYFSFCYFPELVQNKQKLQNLMLNFFNDHVKQHLINHQSYVIDFYVKQDDQVMIIELNPFHNGNFV